jgi:hypothetical protein
MLFPKRHRSVLFISSHESHDLSESVRVSENAIPSCALKAKSWKYSAINMTNYYKKHHLDFRNNDSKGKAFFLKMEYQAKMCADEHRMRKMLY